MTRGRALARRALLALAACLAGSGCVTLESGSLAAVSAQTLPLPMTFVAESVEGRSCVDEAESGFRLAIDDAVRKAPGANALVDAAITFERLCLVVRGKAVRVERPGALD
jgi:hypothetical protein